MSNDPTAYGDPTTLPFWTATQRCQLAIQRCRVCGAHQFYPRLHCLACCSETVEWVRALGTGTVYSMTTVHQRVSDEFVPPYIVAIVELDEGPRMLTNIIGKSCQIGDRVRVVWRERPDAPPLPVFEPVPLIEHIHQLPTDR